MPFPKKRVNKKGSYKIKRKPSKSVSVSSNSGVTNNLTRKQLRKQGRLEKKARRHAFFSGQLSKDMMKDSALSNQEVNDDNETLPSKERKDFPKIKQNKVKNIEKLQMKRRKLLMIEDNKREEKNIHLLAKKLKINRRKSKSLPKFFVNDGLDYLLDVCDSEKIPNLHEPEFSDAESDFDEDFALATNQVQTNAKAEVKRKVTFSLPSQEDNSSNSGDTEPNDSEDESDDYNLSDHSSESSVESGHDEDTDGDDGDIISEKSSSKMTQLVSPIHLLADNDNESCALKSTGFATNDDVEIDSIECNYKHRHKKIKLTNNCWEDIYGRFRDKDGNVIEKKTTNTGSYTPPALRNLPTEKDAQKVEHLERLQKQLKGLLNRLSESNIKPISNEIEELYMKHSRNDINETLITSVMASVVQVALTPERMVQEHALLITLLHANIGPEVGAEFVEKIVIKFNNIHKNDPSYNEGKECNNLLLLLAHLYAFKVVHAVIIYDVLQILADSFLEKDVELILLMLRTAGFNLRKDDPLRLKNVIIKLQSQACNVSHSQDQARVRFMMDTLMAIRNNNMNKIPNYDPSLMEHHKKLLRSLIRKGNSVVELKISLDDILNVESRGRWWVVGSAWTGQQAAEKKPDSNAPSHSIVVNVSDKILDYARKLRMNTGVRKNIFCVIMTAEDYVDGFEKLLRLGLNNQQEREIIHVTIECCMQEKNFNPYYAFLLQKFCSSNRKYQIAIQFAVWDKIRELSAMTSAQLSNLAHLLAHLFTQQALAISVLKVIEFSEMDKTCVRFLRQILLKLLLHDPERDIEAIFIKAAKSPNLHLFREGIRLFMQHFMLKNKEKLPQQVHEKLQTRIQAIDGLLTSCDVVTKF